MFVNRKTCEIKLIFSLRFSSFLLKYDWFTMLFSEVQQSYSYIQIWSNFIMSHKFSLSLFHQVLYLTPYSLANIDVFSVLVLPFLECNINGIIYHTVFWVLLLQHCRLYCRFVHVVYITSLLFFLAECCSIR